MYCGVPRNWPYGAANLDEQLQPLLRANLVRIAVLGDGNALDEFHHEVGPAAVRGPGIEHAGDVRVIHQSQRLPFRLEAGDDLLGIHAELHDLQRHLAADGLDLLGHVHGAETAFSDKLQELVRADALSDEFGLFHLGILELKKGFTPTLFMITQQFFHFRADAGIDFRIPLEEGPALGRGQVRGFLKQLFRLTSSCLVHVLSPYPPSGIGVKIP